MPMGRALEGANTYSVLVTPEDRKPVHLGNLDYDADQPQGKLTAVTPHRKFLLSVTAEKSGNPPSPEGPVVLSQEVDL
jgi:hypothetical protein